MDGRVRWATVHGVAESDTAERLVLSHSRSLSAQALSPILNSTFHSHHLLLASSRNLPACYNLYFSLSYGMQDLFLQYVGSSSLTRD